MSHRQIFIGGSGRSGTTILKTILGWHSEILSLPAEARFIIDPDGIIDLADALSDKWSPYIADNAIYQFERLMKDKLCHSLGKRTLKRILGLLALLTRRRWDPAIQYLWYDIGAIFGRETYNETVDHFLERLYQAQYDGRWSGASNGRRSLYLGQPFSREEIVSIAAEFIDRLFCNLAERKRKRHWCEDSPFNILHADFLLELFPEMKLLCIYRDPRDVVCSYLHQGWAPSTVEHAAMWLRHILSFWETVKRGLPAESYLELGFEDVIQNPHGQIRRVCEFLGVAFEPEMLNIDLSRHHIGRWKNDLRVEDQIIVETHLLEFIVQRSYDNQEKLAQLGDGG